MDRNREIDKLVAKKVMGLIPNGVGGWSPHDNRTGVTIDTNWPLSPYTTDIAAAWQVVEKMRRDGWRVTIHSLKFPARETELWEVWLHEELKFAARGAARGQSVAEAICLAALKAVGVEVKEKADEQ